MKCFIEATLSMYAFHTEGSEMYAFYNYEMFYAVHTYGTDHARTLYTLHNLLYSSHLLCGAAKSK